MSDSSPTETTRARDTMYISLSVIPIILLTIVFAAAWIDWQSSMSSWQRDTETIFGKEALASAVSYDANNSRDYTSRISRMANAADSLSSEIDAQLDFEHEFEPWADYPPEEFFEEVARQGQPIYDEFLDLLPNINSAWQPREHSYYDTAASSGLLRLVSCECIDAIHKSENERAIRALKAFVAMEEVCRGQVQANSIWNRGKWMKSMTSIIYATTLRDFWTQAELKEIEVLLQSPNVASFVSEIREQHKRRKLTQFIATGESGSYRDATARYLEKAAIAPSEKQKLLESNQQWSFSSVNDFRQTQQITRPKHLDQILQIPISGMFDANPLHIDYESLRQQLLRQETTRLAVAAKRFKMEFGRLPKNLTEFGKIGVQPHVRDIYYESRGDEVYFDYGAVPSWP